MKRLIISCDGGGSRCGISTQFLAQLEKHVLAPKGLTLQTAVSAMSGTSAGAILSAFVAAGVPIQRISDELFSPEVMRPMFTSTWGACIPGLGKFFQQYSNEAKLAQLEKFIGRKDTTLHELPMKLLINTYNWTRQSVCLFHNFHPVGMPQVRLADIVHASSSPVYYFAPCEVTFPTTTIVQPFSLTEQNDWWMLYDQRVKGIFSTQSGDVHCDGGTACNNSDMVLYGLARNYWPDDEIFLLSLGTGHPHSDDQPHKPYQSNIFGLMKSNFFDTFYSAPNECRSLECCLMLDPQHYLRIENALPKGMDGSLDNVNAQHLDKLRQLGKEWFHISRTSLQNFIDPIFE